MELYGHLWFISVIVTHVCLRCYIEARVLVACPRRNMFIAVEGDGNHKCMPCSTCPKGTQKKRCSLWRDTDCPQCPEGHYNKRENSRCKSCTVCKPGERIARKCSPTQNAWCAPCPKGTYSAFSNAEHCVMCKRCKQHEEFLYPCNTTHDTGCGECKREYYRDSATGNCIPCAKCHGSSSRSVPECYEKNNGYSDKVCMPVERVIYYSSSTATSTVRASIHGADDEFFAALLPFLFVILFSTAVIVSVFVCIHTSRSTRWCIRKTRDSVGKNDRNMQVNEKDQHHHRKRTKLSEMMRTSWNAVKHCLVVRKCAEHEDTEYSQVNKNDSCREALIVEEQKVLPGTAFNKTCSSCPENVTNTLPSQDSKTNNLIKIIDPDFCVNEDIPLPTATVMDRNTDKLQGIDTSSSTSGRDNCEFDIECDEDTSLMKSLSVSNTLVPTNQESKVTNLDLEINFVEYESQTSCDSDTAKRNNLERKHSSAVVLTNPKDIIYYTL